MSQNKQVGMSIFRKKKDFVKIIILMFLPCLHPQPSQGVCWDSASQGENKDGISGHFCDICAQRTELKTTGTFLRIPPAQRT